MSVFTFLSCKTFTYFRFSTIIPLISFLVVLEWLKFVVCMQGYCRENIPHLSLSLGCTLVCSVCNKIIFLKVRFKFLLKSVCKVCTRDPLSILEVRDPLNILFHLRLFDQKDYSVIQGRVKLRIWYYHSSFLIRKFPFFLFLDQLFWVQAPVLVLKWGGQGGI